MVKKLGFWEQFESLKETVESLGRKDWQLEIKPFLLKAFVEKEDETLYLDFLFEYINQNKLA